MSAILNPSVSRTRTYSVAEYHEKIDRGILTTMDMVELIEGHLVDKMAKNPPHESAFRRLNTRLMALLPAGWVISAQAPVTFTTSEPEPDFTIARGTEADFDTRHPEPGEVGLLVEVSDSSLSFDRTDKWRLYSRGGVPECWVVNVVDRRIEVYTDPTGPTAQPGYRTRTDYQPGAAVPVVLGGVTVGTVPVSEVIV